MNVKYYGIHDLRMFEYGLCKRLRFMANNGWGLRRARANGVF